MNALGLDVRRPLADATLKRIAAGSQRSVVGNPERYIVSYYGAEGDGDARGTPVHQPPPTQTTESASFSSFPR
jgi:hypothetical protein